MPRPDPTPKFVSEIRTNLRARTGMYLGCKGSAGIPVLLDGLAASVLQNTGILSEVRLETEIDASDSQTICMRFRGAVGQSIAAWKTFDQFDTRTILGFHLLMTIAASEDLSLRVSDGQRGWKLRVSDKPSFQFRRLTPRHPPGLFLRMRLHKPTFGRIALADFHRLGGKLRDLSALCPGLAVSLKQGKSGSLMAWCYPGGLSSLIYEIDHARLPLHPECIEFRQQQKGMSVEGTIRFVHAGVPDVRSWVNLHPTHGGAHFEGLGHALKEIFPNADAGCRRVRFVTNPDTGAHVLLPHSFVAALKLQLPDPKYYGPTKDVLMGEDVRELVREAARGPLMRQWEALRERRIG